MIYFISTIFSATYFLLVYLAETKKPYSKRRQATWRLECDLGIITDLDCPVDGGWSPWATWSACQGVCDDIGHRRRLRECVNPPASQDGLPCSGFDEEIEPCFLTNCTVEDFRKLVKGDSARSEALHQLETVPKIMEKCLEVDCTFEDMATDLATDNTWHINSEILWNAVQCVKHDLGCHIMGEWGVWGTWSECGARCGKGLRWRFKKCDTPPPSVSHLTCVGTPLQYEECEGDQCAIDKRYTAQDTSGTWSEWSVWSDCSEKCGTGIRRRQRTCIEKQTLPAAIPWGTHCRGQYYQMEICNNKKCFLNGGWSGWSAWGPCSQTCGAGKRYRRRSCTRPIPTGGGSTCFGSKSEVGTCYLMPCDVFSHVVAVFNGDSYMSYNFTRKRSLFFHFFIRFTTLSPHGTLVRRGLFQKPQIRLSLHKWHICLDVSGTSKPCSLPRTCLSAPIVPGSWHSLLLTVTNEVATIRIDDDQTPIRARFPCDPILLDEAVNIVVGEKFHGEVQEIILNFMPLSMFIAHEREIFGSDFVPSSSSNIVYDKGNIEEAFLILENGQYIRVPCFERQDDWQLELTVKSKREHGIVLYLEGDNNNSFFTVLQNMRLKMKVEIGEYRSEVTSSNEYLPNQWLDISFSKRQATNAIEAIINNGERLHILLYDETERNRRYSQRNDKSHKLFKNNCSIFEVFHKKNEIEDMNNEILNNTICYNELFVAGIPMDVMNKLRNEMKSEVAPFYGVIASFRVNDKLLDLHDCIKECEKDNKMQVSSRTASISGSYREIGWGESNKLNLTCLYARSKTSPQMAYWLYLDNTLLKKGNNEALRTYDNGKILKLIANADNDIRGFYTCRANHKNKKRNIVTYGVLGKIQYKLFEPDYTTIIAIFTTISLVFFTLSWLIVELYYDIKDGYGFFRDENLTLNNSKLDLSNDSEDISKELRLKKRRLLGYRTSSSAQNFERFMDIVKEVTNTQEEYTSDEPKMLPALPGAKKMSLNVSHEVYKCEPTYISSPRHGSYITSPKLTSSLSTENSPRLICSSLLMAKYRRSSKESLPASQKLHRENKELRKPNLLPIKSSTILNSPVQRILQKFKELETHD